VFTGRDGLWKLAQRLIQQTFFWILDNLRIEWLAIALHDDAGNRDPLVDSLAHQFDMPRGVLAETVQPRDIVFVIACRRE